MTKVVTYDHQHRLAV